MRTPANTLFDLNLINSLRRALRVCWKDCHTIIINQYKRVFYFLDLQSDGQTTFGFFQTEKCDIFLCTTDSNQKVVYHKRVFIWPTIFIQLPSKEEWYTEKAIRTTFVSLLLIVCWRPGVIACLNWPNPSFKRSCTYASLPPHLSGQLMLLISPCC